MSNFINSIKNFDDKSSYYLTVEGKGSNQSLTVKHVGFFGKIFMKLGCHNSSMKKVIGYLENNVQLVKTLDDHLKSKLNQKVNSYALKHKLSIHLNLSEALYDNTGYRAVTVQVQKKNNFTQNKDELIALLKNMDLRLWLDDQNCIVGVPNYPVDKDKVIPIVQQVLQKRLTYLKTEIYIDFLKPSCPKDTDINFDQSDRDEYFTQLMIGKEGKVTLDDIMKLPDNMSEIMNKLGIVNAKT